METFELILKEINKTINNWTESFAASVPNILVAIAIIVIFYIISTFLSKWVRKLLNKSHIHISLRMLISSLVKIILISFGFFFALGIVGLDKIVVSLMAGVGVIGLALGFAFQDLASNLISGLFIAVQNPFDIGDYITIKNFSGSVETIRLRDTILLADNGQRIYIPNKTFMEDPLFNYSQMSDKRVDVTIRISYEDDLQKVLELLSRELANMPNKKKGKDVVLYVKEFSLYSILLEVRFWIDVPGIDYIVFTNNVWVKIKYILESNGFHMPSPNIIPSSNESAR
jgi:small conductance mechanosensitive channel